MGGRRCGPVPAARRRGARTDGAEAIDAADPIGPDEPRTGLLARIYGRLVVWLAPLVVLGCLAGTVAAVELLPSIGDAPPTTMNDLLPKNPQALQAERLAIRLFKIPMLTPYVVVQRDPHGLSTAAQEDAYRLAVRVDRRHPPKLDGVVAAPVTNALGLFPHAREHGTTVITYLFFHGSLTANDCWRDSKRYASLFRPRDHVVGVTGALPARLEQFNLIQSNLTYVEGATIALILLIIGLSFRAVIAPLLTVGAAALAFEVSQHVLGWVGQRAGISMPRELTAVAVALMLGIVTDYTVFFLSGTRARLAAGEGRFAAVRRTAASFGPIVLTAGLLVAAGVATLAVGTLDFFRSFGPGMAITVLAGLVMSLTFVPAMLALLGKWAFWPGLSRSVLTVGVGRGRVARLITRRPVAIVLSVAVFAGLGVAASGLTRTGLGLALIRALPASTSTAQAGTAASDGFAAGILAPTEVIVLQPGIAARRGALARLQRDLQAQHGVVSTIGPAQQVAAKRLGVFLAPGGGAARFVLVLSHDPTDAPAIADLEHLQSRMPSLLRDAGLASARVQYAGETALGVETNRTTVTSIWRIALAVFGVNLLFLVVFLRALVAPLYLLLASMAALAATFGLTTYVFQSIFGYGGITYYLPVAIGVLLISLGSDYNLFVVGRIWQEAKARPLVEAVRVAGPRAGRAISIAGIAMALSFALLSIIPLEPFRVFAFSMCVGILLDSLIVRSLLVPALIAAFGRRGYWPNRAPAPPERPAPPPSA